MSAVTKEGYLLIADITGYTSYVASTELEHSQDVLTELLSLITRHTKQLYHIVKLEGDAVFARVEDGEVLNHHTIYDLVETTYCAFRDRVNGIVRLTTCTCQACKAIPDLDLKFFIHHGEYVEQNISDIIDLVGTDVNIVHRMTKNMLNDNFGWNAYLMITASAYVKIGLDLPHQRHVEEYDHIGQIETMNINLHDVYHKIIEERLVFISKEESDAYVELQMEAPLIEAWEWISQPDKRNLTFEDAIWSPITRPNGKLGVGSINHCAHGDNEVTVETVLDWKPFNYYTILNQTHLDRPSRTDHIGTWEFKYDEEKKVTNINYSAKFTNKMNPITKFVISNFMKRGFGKSMSMVMEKVNLLIAQNKIE